MTSVPVQPEFSMHKFASDARKRCEERRARVLAHPDIAKRLTDHPLKYKTPEMWTGFIPPADIPCCARHETKHNDSPHRKALLDICKAVAERENELAA